MKKYSNFIITLCLILIVSVFAVLPYSALADETESSTSQTQIIYGDANSDKLINAVDLLCIKKYISKINQNIDLVCADVNLDSKVNAIDMLYIKKYIIKYNVVLGLTNPNKYNISVDTLTYQSNKDSITLNWSVNGEYEYIKIKDSFNKVVAELGNNVQSYTITGLSAFTPYTYTVYAGADFRGKTYFDEKSIDAVTALETPVTLVSGKTSSSVTVSWNQDNSYDKVEIYYSLQSKNDWNFSKIVSADNLTADVEGLESGKRYDIKIRATAEYNGAKIYSDYSTPHFGTTKPGDISLNIKALSFTSVTLSWKEAEAAQKYQIYRGTAKDGEYEKIAETTELEYKDSGLETGNEYYYYVRSFMNLEGTNYYGQFSIISAQTVSSLDTPQTKVSGKSASEVSVSWEENKTYSEVEIYYSPWKENNWKYYKTVGAENLSADIGGLSAGKRYDVKIRGIAVDDGIKVYSDYSTPHFGTTKPGDIEAVTLESLTNNSVGFSWSEAEAAQKYQIYRGTEKDGEYKKIAETTELEYTDENLEVDTGYYYYIRSFMIIDGTNYYGEFKVYYAMTSANLNTPITTVIGKSASQVTVTWKSDSDYDNVEIYYSPWKENNWKYSKTVDAESLSADVDGLSAGKRYDVRIRGVAVSSVNGNKTYSDYSIQHFGTTKPGDILGLEVTASTNTSVTISWNTADASQKYQIYRSTSKDSGYTKVGETTSLSFKNTGLLGDVQYYYQVRSFMNLEGTNYYGAFSVVGAKTKANYTTYKYGTSYQGRDLTAYIFNPSATKTIFIDFAVHGFEDEYYRDGKVLVECGNNIVKYYNSHLSELKGVRLVVVPCANPDGTYAGTNNSRANSTAFGRCTANHVDMNRDFYSGGFKAKESIALRDLLKKYKPTYYINFHGWLNETLGDSTIGSIFRSTCNLSGNLDGIYAASEGYIIGWVKNNLGSKACLVEFRNTSSVNYLNVVNGLNQLAKK